jgi:signal transduction histidine kinase
MMDSNPKQLGHPIRTRRLDVATLIADVANSYEEVFHQQGIDVDLDVPQNLWVDVDPILIREAFRKLVDNAVEAMPQGGVLVITSLIGRFGLEIEFADSGCGVSDELKERLFEPFATTKHDHAGLGLAMVREIVASHQGTITVSDCPEGGAAFTLMMPVRMANRQAA